MAGNSGSTEDIARRLKEFRAAKAYKMAGNSGSTEDIARRLKEFRAAKASTSSTQEPVILKDSIPITSYEGIVPTDMFQRTESKKDPLQEKIDRYLQHTFEITEIPTQFEELMAITFDLRPVRYDFPDDALSGQPGIMLERYSDDEVAELGRSVIPMIASGFSNSGAAAIFVLAYHLRVLPKKKKNHQRVPGSDTGEEYVLNGAARHSAIADKKYSDYSDRIMSIHGPAEPIAAADDSVKEATVYAYIAASMLRVFTKPASNYVKAWNHIVDGYSSFYGEPMDIRLPMPTVAAMKGLANWFLVDVRARVTLYRILYMSNESTQFMGLKKFLYDIHLSNTGMHIFNILVQLCRAYNCSPGLILTIINIRENGRQVLCLTRLLEILSDTGEKHQLRMWRYGRIFDETFMADLQTKTCPKLVYIMAAALQLEDPKTHGGILGIKQLEDVSDDNKVLCKGAAQQLRRTIRMYQDIEQPRDTGTTTTYKMAGNLGSPEDIACRLKEFRAAKASTSSTQEPVILKDSIPITSYEGIIVPTNMFQASLQ